MFLSSTVCAFLCRTKTKKNKISKHLISFISFHPIFALDNTLVFLHIIIMSPPPPRGRFGTIYGKMLIGQLLFFVIGAFCINQLTVGRGQQKLRKAMEISSKTSSKGRKSWIWKLMVKPGALWAVLERAREIICIFTYSVSGFGGNWQNTIVWHLMVDGGWGQVAPCWTGTTSELRTIIIK